MRLTLAIVVTIALTCAFACAQDDDAPPNWQPEPGDLDPAQNLALRKTVNYSPAPNYGLTKKGDTDSVDLTDGKLSDHPRGHLWFQSQCVGWSYGGRGNLSLDLGQIEPIREIAIRIQGGAPSAGVCTPVWMAAVVSDDGETWRQVGEYSTFRRGDDEAFGVPANEGKAWVHRFRFSDLNTRGRYVGLSLYGAGLTVADEMYVMRGDNEPGDAEMAALPVVDFSTARPEMYLHKPYLCFTTNVTTPNPIGLMAPEGSEAQDVVVTLELPPGVELIEGNGFGRGSDEEPAEPLSTVAAEPIADGWTRYEWSGNAGGATKTWGRLFIGGDWEDGREGEMRYSVAYADGTQGPLMKVPIRAIEIPETPQPKGLIVGLSWYSLGAMVSWPDSLAAFKHMGLNTVTNFPHWIRDQEDPDNAPQWALWEEARAEGFKLLMIDSTFHRIPNEPETRCQFADGTTGTKLCPSYRGRYYQAELDRVAEECAQVKPDYLFPDIELWGWRGPTDDEKCVRCQADFAQSGLETLAEWQLQKGYEMWRDVVTATDAGLMGAGHGPIEYGVYDWVPTSDYQFTWPFKRMYPELLQSAQPSTYSPLYWYHLGLLGDEARASRELLNGPDVLPWISPGDAGAFDGERFRYALLECFCNGSRGMNFWSGRVWDPELLAAYSRVIRNLQPVEDLLLKGELLDGAQVQGAGRISGVTANGEMVLLIADYTNEAGGAVTVTLPVDGAMTATDLDTGETLAVAANGTLTVPLEGVRARVLHVK